MTEAAIEEPVVEAAPAEAAAPAVEAVATPAAEEFTIHADYADKPWADKIKSSEDLYKQIDNLTGMVGKKSIVPDAATATPEELTSYYESLRPETKGDYTFNENTGDAQKDVYSDALFEAGVSKHQADKLIGKIEAANDEMFAKMKDPDEMDTMLKGAFEGDNWKENSDAAFKFAETNGNLNEADQAAFNTMTNEQQLAFYKLSKGMQDFEAKIKDEYGVKESGAQNEGDLGGGEGESLQTQADKLYDEINAEGLKNPPDFKKQAELRTKLNTINSKRAAE